MNLTTYPEVDLLEKVPPAGAQREIRTPSRVIQRPSNHNLPFWSQVMTRRQRRGYDALIGLWLVTVAIFWVWWFDADHVATYSGYITTTILLAWTTLLPIYFLFFTRRMKQVNARIPIPEDWRVAMVVTRAPSEPFEVVKKTLEGMLRQGYMHDTWLADEDPTEEIKYWCSKHGVKVSCRKGIDAYHRAEWPRRTKCKEGNLAYFYDTFGYQLYDFVVQLDADHIPQKGYLEAMLRPFVSNEIGYVSAPSICNLNEGSSWSSRGRLYAEAFMHGPLQAGYNDGYAPLCIGSHYAVRTKALKEIGGLGPELAEDHSTTLLMNGHGWKGAHAFDAIAYGDGPQTFADCVTQEFQWSRSLVVLLFTLLPKYWKKLSWQNRILFLFSELWYPLFAIMMLIGTLLPVIALATDTPLVQVSYFDFLGHMLPVTIATMCLTWYLKIHGWLRPTNSPIFSWEVALFQIVRWPWVLYGTAMGITAAIRKKQLPFRVTPKGKVPEPGLAPKLFVPYVLILAITLVFGFAYSEAIDARGYHYFILLNATIYTSACFSILYRQDKERKQLIRSEL